MTKCQKKVILTNLSVKICRYKMSRDAVLKINLTHYLTDNQSHWSVGSPQINYIGGWHLVQYLPEILPEVWHRTTFKNYLYNYLQTSKKIKIRIFKKILKCYLQPTKQLSIRHKSRHNPDTIPYTVNTD